MKYQRRHYETIAAGLKAKNAPSSEVEEWIRKFQADNPRFRADYFTAAVRGERSNRSRPRRPFKVPTLAGYKGKACRFGKKRKHGRWVCRKSPRRK